MKTFFLVVIYGTEPSQSKTLSSIVQNKLSFLGFYENSELIIYNNGPKHFSVNNIENSSLLTSLNEIFLNLIITQDVRNSALSKIYNSIIEERKESNSQFVILDGDTIVTDDFIFNVFNNTSSDLLLPLVKEQSDEQIYYPLIDFQPVKHAMTKIESYVLSIGSGLIIRSRLIEMFNSFGLAVFDERFALYGVDSCFFKNVHKLKRYPSNNIKIDICGSIFHSLSRISGDKSKFRTMERAFDVVLTERYYRESALYSKVLVVIIKILLSQGLLSALQVLRVFIKGRHPRC